MQEIPSISLRSLRCDLVVGTRPEAIKLAPVARALREREGEFAVRIVTSGQHREICRSALAAFGLGADTALQTEPIQGSLADSASDLLRVFGRHVAESRPDVIVVQGDTTTALAAALAGFYARIPVAHVEAGLRSGQRWSPYPEEINRRVIDQIADVLFAPTRGAAARLADEGFSTNRVRVTGSTVVDALLAIRD